MVIFYFRLKFMKADGIEEQGSERLQQLLLALLALCGIVLRYQGLNTAFWLDEIWATEALSSLNSWKDIFTRYRQDNNHFLVSLFSYLIGPTKDWVLYRLPHFIAGCGTFIVLYLIVRSWTKLSAFIAFFFFSFSYLFILYSSEARGYALVVFFALLSFYLFKLIFNSQNTSLSSYVAFWLAAILGVLSHLSFLQLYFALFVYGIYLWLKEKQLRISFWRLVFLHAVPIFSFVLLWIINLRFIPAGSGPLRSHIEVIFNVFAFMLAGLELSAERLNEGAFILLAAPLFLAFLISEIVMLKRDGQRVWIFYLLIIFVAPILSILILEPRVIFIRYFIINIIFGYLLLAKFIERGLKGAAAGKVVAVIILAVFLVGHGRLAFSFIKNGRGAPQEALAYMLQQSDQKLTYASDQAFRNDTLINFYKSYLDPSVTFSKSKTPQWYITHSLDARFKPLEELEYEGIRFKLDKVYPHTALSGFSWYLYRH